MQSHANSRLPPPQTDTMRQVPSGLFTAPGAVLNDLPDQLEMNDKDSRAMCIAAECLGCCYVYDICGSLRTMTAIEDKKNKYNIGLFIFYEWCWPCMICLKHCFGVSNENLREIPRKLPFKFTDLNADWPQDSATAGSAMK